MSASEMQECHIPACLITNYRNYSYDANFMLVEQVIDVECDEN